MSGGSYDYISFKIDDAAHQLRNKENDSRRASFAMLLELIAEALHKIEWVDSGDCASGDEYESIDEVFAFLKASPEIIKKAHAFDSLKEQLKKFLGE